MSYGYSVAPLAFDGTFAYVLGTEPTPNPTPVKLTVVELVTESSMPPRLETRSFMPLAGAQGLALEGRTLSIQMQNAVGQLDVSTAASPKWSKHAYVAANGVSAVAPFGDLVLAAQIDGVTAVNLADASDITLLPLAKPDWLGGAVTQGALAYLVRGDSGLVIQDVRDPKKPVVLSATKMPAIDIALSGHHAYVTVEGEGLRIYDVRAPGAPERVGSIAEREVGRVIVDHGRAYVQCAQSSLCVYDVTTPSAPALLVKDSKILYPTVGYTSRHTSFTVRDHLLYLPQGDQLAIVDVQTPTAPAPLGTIALTGMKSGDNVFLALQGNHAIVAHGCHTVSGNDCFDVLDVSNPKAITRVGEAVYTIPDDLHDVRMRSMTLAGAHVFVTLESGYVLGLDFTKPEAPVLDTPLWTTQPGFAAFASGRFLTTHVSGNVPGQADQVIELCK